MLLLINKKPQKISANLPIMERYALLCSGYIQVIANANRPPCNDNPTKIYLELVV